jgi:hypothetical protein
VFSLSPAGLVSAVLAIAVFAAGCGGGSDGGDSAGSTKAAYIKLADAVCTKTNVDEADAISDWEVENGAKRPGLKPPTSMQELKLVMPIIRREVREIAALEPPPGDEAEVDAFVSAYQEASKETIADLLDGKSKKYETAYKLMQHFGFKVCGVS